MGVYSGGEAEVVPLKEDGSRKPVDEIMVKK